MSKKIGLLALLGLLGTLWWWRGALPRNNTVAAAGPRAGYFANALLRTHEGREVRFYDDLVRGKIVVLNFMYTQCDGI